ncbi:glycoside hydrolase family 3 C-terminal domain-containing protein [Streptomyces sp. NPDC020096]
MLAPAAHADNAASSACPWVASSAPVGQRVDQVMAQITQDEEIALVHGNGQTTPYVGNVPGIPRLCIPSLGLEDGPAGVGDGMTGVTQLPAPVAGAASWDTALEQQYGAVIGAEDAGKGANIALGPTVNIVRDPRWGRAFESLGEDPYLAGKMGAANITGIQSQGVMAQVKHLAVYNQETNRNSDADNAIVSERAMQEIYLPAFQAASQAGASSLMCAYSWVNGQDACANPYLQNTVMKSQFGFKGFVTSDWDATHSTDASAYNGLDMQMPGDQYFGSALNSAVTSGQVPKSRLDDMVRRILRQMFTFGLFDKSPTGSPSAVVTSDAHAATARQVAEEGSVLLKNADGVLPLRSSNVNSIAVIGADADTKAQTAGGGSAGVNAPHVVTPLQGITNRAGSGIKVHYNDGSDPNSAASTAASSSVAVVFASTSEQEGGDLGNIDLSSADNALISAVAAKNPHTIVVLNTGSAVTMPWIDQVAGVFESWYPGQEDGTAIAALLFGDTNPSGKLPVSFPKSLTDVPASTPEQWTGSNGQVQYSEGVNVGYRWYDSKNIAPLFPFGYGLSYTTFSYGNLAVTGPDANGTINVSATVTNTGDRQGADVAQLYIGDPSNTGEPPHQLKGFQRVDLAPGASTTVHFTLGAKDLSYWDQTAHGWTAPAGQYQIAVGDSSRNLPLTGTATLATTTAPPTGSITGIAGLCLDDQSASTDNRNPIQLYGCNNTGAQKWTVTSDHRLTVFGKCTDAKDGGTANGTLIQLYDCNGTGAQIWEPQSNGALYNPQSGRCLDDPGATTDQKSQLQLYDCNGTDAQKWNLP